MNLWISKIYTFYFNLIRPISQYNSLTDPNLQGYYSKSIIRTHLKQIGLVILDNYYLAVVQGKWWIKLFERSIKEAK